MTQILPKDDLFTEEASHYGTWLSGYIRTIPWTTPLVLAHPVSGSYSISNSNGNLFSGYSNFAAGLPINPYGASGLLASFVSSDGVQTQFCATMRRDLYLLDTRVAVAFQGVAINGTFGADSFRWAAIGARLQAGTYVETSGAERIVLTTGYWLVLAHTAALGSTFYLLRVVSGTATILASIAATTLDSNWVMPNAVGSLRTLTLDVTNVGGVPTLTAKTSKIGPYVVGQQPPMEHMIFNGVIDSGGITTAGRAGFGFCCDRESGTVKSTTVAQWFQITDLATSTVKLHDEWQRGPAIVCGRQLTDLNARLGYNLACGWKGDVHTEPASGVARVLKRDSGSNRIIHDEAVGASHNSNISTRPAPNIYHQRRQATFRMTSPSTETIGFGIMCRGGVTSTGLFSLGWIFQLVHTTGSVWTARLLVCNAVGGGTQAASAVLNAGAYGLAADTNITLDLQVKNIGVGAPATGNTNVLAKVGSTTIGWTLALPPNQIEALADGSVTYLVGGQFNSGEIEGLYSFSDNVVGSYVRMDTWTDLSTAPSGPLTGEDDLASIAVSSEVTGKTGTLTVPLEWPVTVRRHQRVNRTRMDSGHTQRTARSLRQRRVWDVEARASKPVDTAALFTLWDSHNGCEIPFDWVEPDGTTVAVAFDTPNLGQILRAPLVESFSFALRERLAP